MDRCISQTAATTTTLRIQQESPLLQLPAELRNMIYNYAFQGIETCISRSESPTITLSVDIRSEQVNDCTCSGIAKHNALARVCRQTHAETQHLLISKMTFFFEDAHVQKLFLARLTDAQLHAITTVGLSTGETWFIGLFYKDIRENQSLSLRIDPLTDMDKKARAVLYGRAGLRRLPGLRRVVVDKWLRRHGRGESNICATAGIRFCADNRSLEVILG